MIDLEKELRELSPEARYRVFAEGLELWRICSGAACQRAQACRGDPLRCFRRCADWAESVAAAAKRERHANDPATEALRADLARMIGRLAATARDEADKG
jgi:hypothetical protein